MTLLYCWFGQPTQQNVLLGELQSISVATLVLQESMSNRVGMDTSEKGKDLIVELLKGGYHLEEGEYRLRDLADFNRDALISLIRRSPTISLICPRDEAASISGEIEAFEKKKKANKLRRKLNKETVDIGSPPHFYKLYNCSSAIINEDALPRYVDDNHKLISWKISDFGLHCYVIAKNYEILDSWVSTICSRAGIEKKVVLHERELPVH